MLQRIQTVYLLIAAIAIMALHFLPLAQIAGEQENFILNAKGIYTASGEVKESSFIISLIIIVEIIFTLFIIFQYKKRNRQILMTKLSLLFLTVLIAVVFFYSDYAKALTGLPKDALVNYQFACILPVISIVMNYLAIRAIKKDEELVRASDRLR